MSRLFCFLLAASIYFIPIFSYGIERSCDISDVLPKVVQQINQINDYSLIAHAEFSEYHSTTNIKGKPPKNLRLEMRISDSKHHIKSLHVYDEKFQWIENSRGKDGVKEILRIELSKVVKEGRPFDTGYSLMGSGLLTGEDFPATLRILISLYDLKMLCKEKKSFLVGQIRMDKLQEYSNLKNGVSRQSLFKQFAKQFSHIKILLENDTYIIGGYTLSDGSDNKEFKVKFTEVKINKGLTDEFLTYTPLKHDKVIDITDDVKNLRE